MLSKLLASLGVLVAIVTLSACGSSHTTSTQLAATKANVSVDLNGTWHQSNVGIRGITMVAHIADGSIEIDMKLNDESGIYWVGDFAPPPAVSNSSEVTSDGDVETMSLDILASQDLTKTFTYNNGELSFPFSIMGESTVVQLSK